MLRILFILALALSGSVRLQADPPAFDVVSIKRAEPGARGTPPMAIAELVALCSARLNQYRCSGVTTRSLVRVAFPGADGVQLPMSQIVGGPDWIRTIQFNVEAKMAEGATLSLSDVPRLVRAMLEDRFKLVAHTEPRPFPVYVLVNARGDGSPGPQLKPSTTDCAPLPKDAPAPPAGMPVERRCFGGIFRPGTIQSANATMADLVRSLTNFSGDSRIVVDLTGLTGKFDLELRWSADPAQPSDLPPLVTAIQEQLGLKLEPRTEALPALVIDHIEPPSPN